MVLLLFAVKGLPSLSLTLATKGLPLLSLTVRPLSSAGVTVMP